VVSLHLTSDTSGLYPGLVHFFTNYGTGQNTSVKKVPIKWLDLKALGKLKSIT